MSKDIDGMLNIENQSYVVISTEKFSHYDAEHLRRCLGVPQIQDLWVGYLIRQHRYIKGLSQAELAKRTSTGQKHIDKIENKVIRKPNNKLLKKIAMTLGKDFEDGLKLIGVSIT